MKNSITILIILTLIAANLGFSFKINNDLQRHIGEFKGYIAAKKK